MGDENWEDNAYYQINTYLDWVKTEDEDPRIVELDERECARNGVTSKMRELGAGRGAQAGAVA